MPHLCAGGSTKAGGRTPHTCQSAACCAEPSPTSRLQFPSLLPLRTCSGQGPCSMAPMPHCWWGDAAKKRRRTWSCGTSAPLTSSSRLRCALGPARTQVSEQQAQLAARGVMKRQSPCGWQPACLPGCLLCSAFPLFRGPLLSAICCPSTRVAISCPIQPPFSMLRTAVYSMIETLLPDAGTAAKSGGQARLLELAFPPAGGLGPSGRPGWVTVVQTQGAGPA